MKKSPVQKRRVEDQIRRGLFPAPASRHGGGWFRDPAPGRCLSSVSISPKRLVLETKLEHKVKRDSEKMSLEVELEWRPSGREGSFGGVELA